MQNNKPIAPQVTFQEISADQCGQRLDNFLLTHLKGVPKSHIYRIVRKGEVRVNKGRKEAKYRLCQGDIVRIPPVKTAQRPTDILIPGMLEQALKSQVLFEDDFLMIINKPAGFAVHGGSGLQSGIIEALRQMRPEARFLELVHRLDRDTSGCLIIAKKRSALRLLHELFRSEGIKKIYLALLAGRWERKKILIDKPLQKNVAQGGERMVIVSRSGKPAETILRRRLLLTDSTLVEASPLTGRTHQIRVHTASIGHPIIGDTRYGEKSRNHSFRKRGYKRMMLHAHQLTFTHPDTEKILTVTAPMPEELTRLITDERQV